MEVKIYTTEHCKYCFQLKRILSLLRISYTNVDIDESENKNEYEEIVKEIKHYYIPVIKIGDQFLSPNTDFQTINEAANIVFKKLKSV